jgi:hypothetical protein
MKNIRWILFVGAIVSFGMIGCSKTGATGPAGPAGPVGPASVFSSQWITLQMVGGLDTNGDSLYTETITASSITTDILDSGIILTYVNDGTDAVVPYTFFTQTSWEVYSTGQIDLFSFTNQLTGFAYRYVTIPGQLVVGNGTQRTYKGYTPQELQSMPFEKVQTLAADKN